MDVTVRSESYLSDDHSWLGSAHGVGTGDTIELDLELFTEADHFPDGYLPSGLVVAKADASGKYGPYDATTPGLGEAKYHLLFAVPVSGSTDGTGSFIGVGFRRGKVVEANLPDNHGLDDAAKQALSLIDYV